MAVQWLILRPATPHLPLIPSNGFMPEIQGKKRAPTGLPSRFQVFLDMIWIFNLRETNPRPVNFPLNNDAMMQQLYM